MKTPASLEVLLQADPEDRIWIQPAQNVFAANAKDLTGSELLAGGVNVAATYLATLVTANPAALIVAGPVLEKVGFVAWEAIKAARDVSAAPFDARLRGRLHNLTANLAADMLGHDPAYAAMMYGLLSHGTSPTIASAASFLAAIPVAAAVQTGGGEALHRGLKWLSTRQGFQWEQYVETRFLVLENERARDTFLQTSERFGLGDDHTNLYEDTYYTHRVPAFGNRLGHVRMRAVHGMLSYRNLELSYTFPQKHAQDTSEFNLCYVRKEKGRRPMPDSLPRSLRPFVAPTSRQVLFERRVRHNDDIRLALDTLYLPSGKELFLVELKAYSVSEQFFPAMRYLLRHAHTVLTNYPKVRLLDEFGYASRGSAHAT